MKILIALRYEEGDPNEPVRLALADGSTIDMGPESASTHASLDAFLGEFIKKDPA